MPEEAKQEAPEEQAPVKPAFTVDEAATAGPEHPSVASDEADSGEGEGPDDHTAGGFEVQDAITETAVDPPKT